MLTFAFGNVQLHFIRHKKKSNEIYCFKKFINICYFVKTRKQSKAKQSHKKNYKIYKTHRYIKSWMKKWKKNRKKKT